MLSLGIVLLAALAGGAWRRWWGWTQPAWLRLANGNDRPGLRPAQAVIGAAALAGLCLWLHPWWEAALRTGLAMALMTERAQCIPLIWAAWERLSYRIEWLRTRWTWGAEATAGAVVFALAV